MRHARRGPRTEQVTDREPEVARGGAAAAVRWNLLAVVGRQGFGVVGAVVLANILGPASYGVISAATLYVTATTLLLDQGLAAALIQRPTLSRWAGGAAATMNLLTGALLAVLTWVLAPWVAQFFRVEELTAVLHWLGAGLVVKSLAIAPRALQSRRMVFRAIAIADIGGAAAGTAAGVTAALLGAGPQSMVYQVLTTDLVVAVVLLVAQRGPVPNARVGEVARMLPFGLRVMATNSIAFFSRNVDNLLVGRVLGIVALSYYAMAYRVLAIPVQLIGQTIARVMFPAFSRMAHRRDELAATLVTVTRLLAFVAVPVMGLIAAASHELVRVVLGEVWLPSAPLVAVLAVAGARETIFYVTAALMKATGEVRLAVRYELLATAVQVGGIVAGLQLGLIWVAVGYAAAGFVLTPVLLAIQRRLTDVAIRDQLSAIAPPVHAASWGAVAYLGVRATDLGPLATVLLGGTAYLVVLAAVLLLVHRGATLRALRQARTVLPGGRGERVAASA